METKIALVPRALATSKAGGIKEYAVLITDVRTILVLEKGVSAWASQTIGPVLASAATTRKTINYQDATPEQLVQLEKSVSIPHDHVRRLRLKKGFWRAPPSLLIEYDDSEGKAKKIKVRLDPPGDFLKQQKKEGFGRGDILASYAGRVRDAYVKALPPAQQGKAEWRL